MLQQIRVAQGHMRERREDGEGEGKRMLWTMDFRRVLRRMEEVEEEEEDLDWYERDPETEADDILRGAAPGLSSLPHPSFVVNGLSISKDRENADAAIASVPSPPGSSSSIFS